MRETSQAVVVPDQHWPNLTTLGVPVQERDWSDLVNVM